MRPGGGKSKRAKSDEWATEKWLFRYLSEIYGPFDVDVAAAPWNAKCERFYTKRDNALVQQWGRRNWCNSPYWKGMKEAFTNRGRIFVEDAKSELSCHLLPMDTADGYWERHVRAPAGKLLGVTVHQSQLGWVTQTAWEYLTVEVTEVFGRLKYRHRDGSTGTAMHSSAVVVFARPGLLASLRLGDARSQLPIHTSGRGAK